MQIPLKEFNKNSVIIDFQSELVPNYETGIFEIKNYSEIRFIKEVIYSDILEINGMEWRLKVYPNGNGIAKGSYLSIFLEMKKGYTEYNKYEYRVELVNQKNPKLSIYRFINLENLQVNLQIMNAGVIIDFLS